MSASFVRMERQTILAPLGVRFADAVTREPVDDGLAVHVYPTASPQWRTRAFPNRSGTFVLHRAAGLQNATRGAGDEQFWNALPPGRSYTVEVADARGRFLPLVFSTPLPVRGLFRWIWPLYDATSAPQPTPAQAFRDDFTDATMDASKWTKNTLNPPQSSTFDKDIVVSEVGGRLEITPRSKMGGTHYSGYVSAARWNATNARATVEVAQAAQNGAETFFTLALDTDNWLRFYVQGATPNVQLFMQTKLGVNATVTAIPYSAAQHRWWRFRHDRAADQFAFETSPDGLVWTRRRAVARPFAVTSVLLELGAGTGASVADPGKAVFDNFLMESNPVPAVPLFSAPARRAGTGMAVIRAELWNPVAKAPASFALFEARVVGRQTMRGVADRQGRVALVFPYPEPTVPPDAPGQPAPVPPLTRQEWAVEVRAYYKTPAAGATPPTVPELAATLAQPRAELWADEARSAPLTRATMRFGQELVVRSQRNVANAPLDPVPLPVLLVTPTA